MKKYFQKINFKLPPIDMNRIITNTVVESYATQYLIDKNISPTFHSYEIKDMEYFTEIYSQKIKFNIQPDFINYTRITEDGATPHVDKVKSVINYYIDSGNCVTTFWEPKDINFVPPGLRQLRKDGQWHESEVLVYDISQLHFACCFRALPNQAYALSTKDIHSVFKPKHDTVRTFFRFMWFDLTIDELLNNIILVNN